MYSTMYGTHNFRIFKCKTRNKTMICENYNVVHNREIITISELNRCSYIKYIIVWLSEKKCFSLNQFFNFLKVCTVRLI